MSDRRIVQYHAAHFFEQHIPNSYSPVRVTATIMKPFEMSKTQAQLTLTQQMQADHCC
jgi:hypothetical protein